MSTGKEIVAMVDDAIATLTIDLSVLEERYDLTTFRCGVQFMQMLQHKAPDLVLLDVDLPDVNGFEVIMSLKSDARLTDVPVVVLSQSNDWEQELQGLTLGAADYIIKPVSPSVLHKRVEAALLTGTQKKELAQLNQNLQSIVDEKTRAVVELKNAILSTMAELVEFRDVFTGGHIARTQIYLRTLIEALQEADIYQEEVLSWDVELILRSAQLHDVGKIAVSDRILRKSSKLTNAEFEKIKKHVLIGEQVIEHMKKATSEHDFLEYASIMATSHHEKWDGTGYYRKLKGREIPLQSRLMAIADVYDALVSERPYKDRFPHEEAVEVIKSESGSHFDPLLVELFLSVADKFEKINIECKYLSQPRSSYESKRFV